MSIPTEVIMRMATLGLSEEQAKAVADMLTTVETATAETVSASYEERIEESREKGRERWRKWKTTHPTNVSKREPTLANGSKQLVGGDAPVEDKTSNLVIEPQEKKVSKVRACRLPTDFAPDVSWAVSQGLSPSQADAEAAKFRDYWSAKGSNATKTDWPATWRNWVRQSLERKPTGPPASKSRTPLDVARELRIEMEQAHAEPPRQDQADRAVVVSLPHYRHG
jgi:hypothetical protein